MQRTSLHAVHRLLHCISRVLRVVASILKACAGEKKERLATDYCPLVDPLRKAVPWKHIIVKGSTSVNSEGCACKLSTSCLTWSQDLVGMCSKSCSLLHRCVYRRTQLHQQVPYKSRLRKYNRWADLILWIRLAVLCI